MECCLYAFFLGVFRVEDDVDIVFHEKDKEEKLYKDYFCCNENSSYMELVDWSFKQGKRRLGLDRKVLDEFISPQDKACVVWKSYHSGIPRPVPNDELVTEIADTLFHGYRWDR